MPKKDVDGSLFLLGRGKVYFDRKTDAGIYTGEQFLGNCPRVEITPSQESVEARSAADPASALVAYDIISQDYELGLKPNEFDPYNLALAFFGKEALYSQNNTAVVDEQLNPNSAGVAQPVYQGRYYRLGVDKRNIASVQAVRLAGTATTKTGWELDGVEARLYIVPGGDIADGAALEIDYTPTTVTDRPMVQAGESPTIEGRMRVVQNNKRGTNRTYEFWNVSFRSDEALSLIDNTYGEIQIKAKVLADPTGHPTNQYFRIINQS